MTRSRVCALAASAVVLAVVGDARGQSPSAAVDVEQFRLGPGYQDVLGLVSPETQGHLRWSIGAFLNGADDPLELRDDQGVTRGRVVQSRFGAELFGSIGLGRRFELGLALPFGLQNTGDGDVVTGPYPALTAAGLGDARLVPRVAVIDGHPRFRLGVAAPLILPTGDDSSFFGGAGLGIAPTVTADYRPNKSTTVLVNGGVLLRGKEQIGQLDVGSELSFGIGARRAVTIADRPFAVSGSVSARLGLSDAEPEEIPAEALLAMDYLGVRDVIVTAGLGAGLSRGYGTPDARVFVGVKYRPSRARPVTPPATCAHGPEDLDGFEDGDGCADPDNDGDGIDDDSDNCPNEAETVNGDRDADGCPEAPVTKRNETLDPPAVPADKDGDGIVGDDDLCPEIAEDKDGFEDGDGCPDPDNDGDNIPDSKDKCPNQAEVVNNVEDTDGCPDSQVTRTRIFLIRGIEFATNSAVIRKRSYPVLDQVVSVLRAHPDILLVRIEGHTDSRGGAVFNLGLSRRRAASVRRYLINKGIAAKRLQSRGYGLTKPIADNKTAKGRARNRRVEFKILRWKGSGAGGASK